MNLLSPKIAIRYIFSKKSHSALNLISVVAICGIVVTTAAMVCVLSVFNGFSELIESKLSAIDPDVKIYPRTGKAIAQADSIAEELQAEFDEIRFALPVIEENALAVYADKQMPVRIKAVPEEYELSCGIAEAVKPNGRYNLTDSFGNYAVISIGTAVGLHAYPGYVNSMELYSPRRQGKVNIANPAGAFMADTLFISGVFQIDEMSYDASTVLVPTEVGRYLFDYPDQATAIELSIDSTASKPETISRIANRLGKDYEVKDRLMQQESSFVMINIEKWISFLLLGFILLIAMFNVISALSVLIVEKKSAIDSLLNLGATNGMIVNVFRWQTVIIGAIGIIAGVALGVTACLIQEHFGIIKLNGDPETMIVDRYPVVVNCADVIAVTIMSITVSALAAIGVGFIASSRIPKAKD